MKGKSDESNQAPLSEMQMVMLERLLRANTAAQTEALINLVRSQRSSADSDNDDSAPREFLAMLDVAIWNGPALSGENAENLWDFTGSGEVWEGTGQQLYDLLRSSSKENRIHELLGTHGALNKLLGKTKDAYPRRVKQHRKACANHWRIMRP